VTCAVPQGSVLGTILFLIYMNEIDKAIPEEKVKLFADDTNLFLFDKDSKSLSLKATECLNKLNQRFVANKLTLYLSKTCYRLMFFFRQKRTKILN